MKISFVIPVYKVEQYLAQCVSSITGQTYRDIEVVLVDDGSPDGCPALCDKLAESDARICVIHKENGGLSDARNAGLKKATGDYVIFVDGDDFWIGNDSLQELVDIAVRHIELDFIGYNCNYYYPDSNKMTEWVPYEDALSESSDRNSVVVALVKSGTFPMSACLKMHKREFLIKNQLFFEKGKVAEDIPWFINVLDATDRCCFINKYIYAYRQNVAGSITNSAGHRSFDNLFDMFKTELPKIEQRSFNEDAKKAIKSFLAYEYCILLTYRGIDKKTKKELRSYQNVLCYDLNPKIKMALRIYKIFGIRITEMIMSIYQWVRKHKK